MRIVTMPKKIGQKIEVQDGLPVDHCADVRNMVEPAGMLAEDAAEAKRMTYAGRRDVALRQAKIFDESRIEKSPLFENAKRQGGLF